MARKRIGELLLERRAITAPQLEAGLEAQQQSRRRLGETLVTQGAISEETLAQALSEALEVPLVQLEGRPPDWSAIHLLRARFCELHALFPVALESEEGRRHLVVAMGDPLNTTALQEMEFVTGMKVHARVAPLSSIRAAIQRHYHRPPSSRVPGATAARSAQAPASGSEDEEVLVGEEVSAGGVSLETLIQQREQERRRRRSQPRASATADLGAELDSLIGEVTGAVAAAEVDPVEELERKFWALMRIMARKGLLSKEEFIRELDDEQEG
jgi:hypothetical protein